MLGDQRYAPDPSPGDVTLAVHPRSFLVMMLHWQEREVDPQHGSFLTILFVCSSRHKSTVVENRCRIPMPIETSACGEPPFFG